MNWMGGSRHRVLGTNNTLIEKQEEFFRNQRSQRSSPALRLSLGAHQQEIPASWSTAAKPPPSAPAPFEAEVRPASRCSSLPVSEPTPGRHHQGSQDTSFLDLGPLRPAGVSGVKAVGESKQARPRQANLWDDTKPESNKRTASQTLDVSCAGYLDDFCHAWLAASQLLLIGFLNAQSIILSGKLPKPNYQAEVTTGARHRRQAQARVIDDQECRQQDRENYSAGVNVSQQEGVAARPTNSVLKRSRRSPRPLRSTFDSEEPVPEQSASMLGHSPMRQMGDFPRHISPESQAESQSAEPSARPGAGIQEAPTAFNEECRRLWSLVDSLNHVIASQTATIGSLQQLLQQQVPAATNSCCGCLGPRRHGGSNHHHGQSQDAEGRGRCGMVIQVPASAPQPQSGRGAATSAVEDADLRALSRSLVPYTGGRPAEPFDPDR